MVSKAPESPSPARQLHPAEPITLSLTPAAEQQQPARHQGKRKGGTPQPEDSDTDTEAAPVAQQMLSFIMDDPDFESEGSDTPKVAKVKQNILACTTVSV